MSRKQADKIEPIIIEKPIMEMIKKIEITEGNIIFTGTPNSGKTTVVNELVKKGKEENIEYLFLKNLAELSWIVLDEQELTHYLEMCIFRSLYESCIKNMYDEIANFVGNGDSDNAQKLASWYTIFEDQNEMVKKSLKELHEYLNGGKAKGAIINLYKFGEITLPIIDYLNKRGKRVNAVFDRFEYTRKRVVQEAIIKCCSLFTKSVIVVDENVLSGHEYKFENRGFKILKCDYNKDIDFVKQFIKERFEQYLKMEMKIQDPEDFCIPPDIKSEEIITPEVIDKIIERANGDLTLIEIMLKKIVDGLAWNLADGIRIPDSINDTIGYVMSADTSTKEYSKKYPPKAIVI